MLIIFIDALPASKKIELEGFKSKKLIPNLGYSVNLHNEIFAGKTPDQMGFFGEYLFEDNASFIKKIIFWFLNIIEYAPFNLNYLFKIFLRKIFNIRVGQIPFKLIPYFKRRGKYPFTNECPSILNNFKKFVTDNMQNGLGNRDAVAVKNALDYLKKDPINKNIFISLCDLDGIGHKFGTDSNEYLSRLQFLQKNCNRVIKEYLAKNKNSPVIILSDHGMSNVKSFIDPKKVLSKIQKKHKIKFFYDSLYLQIFAEKSSSAGKTIHSVKKIIETELPVHVFSDSERAKYGVTSTKFGNLIALLNDGLAFSPNLFGYIKMRAYHGYLPNNDNNMGVFLYKNFEIPSDIINVSSIKAYDLIHDNTTR